jgi:peptidase YpeB-like protein
MVEYLVMEAAFPLASHRTMPALTRARRHSSARYQIRPLILGVMKRKVLIALGALLATAAISAGSIGVYEYFRPAHGYWNEATEGLHGWRAAEGANKGTLLPLSQALDLAAKHLPGEVLKVELENKHGRSTYEIKVLTETGRLREIELDARTGTVLEIEDD